MTTQDDYADDLRRTLASVSARIEEMEQARRGATPAENVVIAGDLEVFKTRHAAIAEKLDRFQHEPEHHWSALRTEIAKDVDAFSAELGRFVLQDRRYE